MDSRPPARINVFEPASAPAIAGTNTKLLASVPTSASATLAATVHISLNEDTDGNLAQPVKGRHNKRFYGPDSGAVYEEMREDASQ
jgi:hypothetical protein